MEGTTTLADALLEDLDDLNDSGDDEEEEGAFDQQTRDEDDNDQKAAIKSEHNGNLKQDPSAVSSSAASLLEKTKKASRFLDNPSLQRHMRAIRERRLGGEDQKVKAESNNTSSNNNKEQQEEDHKLVVQSNKHLANLAEELAMAQGALAKAYKPKFPELEELLPNLMQYKNAVRIIGNEMDLTKVNDELNEILHSNQIITISVAGSTTAGRPLTDEELAQVDEAATYMEQLFELQTELIQFVEQSMEGLAPSICALIGPTLAARLIGLAGGLAELTKIPACNLQVLGQVKQTSTSRAGMSTTNMQQQHHAGLLMECELVQRMPKPIQKKALKAVAAKLTLAARFDFVNADTGRPRSAEAGRKYRQELHDKFEKLLEPDKAPVLKALPKPDLSVKKRRGGKRMRRWKERFEETALMKQANTRAFSSQQGEYGDDAMGITMGLLDTADSGGAIRKTTEKRKMRQANTKASRKKAVQMASKAQNKDGLASSVVFSQTSSMELVNPDAMKDRVRDANRKWFNENAGFQSALPPKDR